MNAVPARVDIAANIPRSMILPANEAELSRLTHDVINAFNGVLVFLEAADVIRRYQPTSRIQNGRVWGPAPMDEHPGWQWRFIITRDPAAPEMFSYAFEVQRIGGGDVLDPVHRGHVRGHRRRPQGDGPLPHRDRRPARGAAFRSTSTPRASCSRSST